MAVLSATYTGGISVSLSGVCAAIYNVVGAKSIPAQLAESLNFTGVVGISNSAISAVGFEHATPAAAGTTTIALQTAVNGIVDESFAFTFVKAFLIVNNGTEDIALNGAFVETVCGVVAAEYVLSPGDVWASSKTTAGWAAGNLVVDNTGGGVTADVDIFVIGLK